MHGEPGFSVVRVEADAESARATAARDVPDGVLVDVQLPGEPGRGLCLRLDGADRRPRLVLYSAFADERLAVLAAVAGRSCTGSAPVAAAAASRVDETSPDRVAGELDPVVHPELLEDVRPVALHRLRADHERGGDLVVGLRLGDQLDHLELARGEDLLRR